MVGNMWKPLKVLVALTLYNVVKRTEHKKKHHWHMIQLHGCIREIYESLSSGL